ncbi:MFS transporter [Rhizobium sp. SSA_523]|uniref:MFS transporter n=1 Tax=Rhizobium sp. SSA_523 TaxID=2952477 RepID=UPI0020906530|nr:MFS transporter [Rhizobium sp. SSA_523]MCO5730780.1 MFS transporter [Rhizobium sp. SSA_523]WKC24397.1 MFS transporter [Rhizobium sp. SSA_523]
MTASMENRQDSAAAATEPAEAARDSSQPLPAAPTPQDGAPLPRLPQDLPKQPVPLEERPAWLTLAYILSGLLMFLTQGLGMNIVSANIYQLQGTFSATLAEVAALSAAYVAPYASLSLALFKIRVQYGLRPFAELSIAAFVAAACLNLFVTDYHSALVIRFVSGMAAAPLSSLGFLYILEAFSPQKKLTIGLSIALTGTLLASPVARIISPGLLDLDGYQALYTMELGLALCALPIIYLLPLTAPPKAKVIERMDVFTYLLLAVGLGAFAVFFTLGRFYWWFEAPWLGLLLATSIVFLTLFAVIELHRKNPLLDLRWIFTWPNLHLAGVLIVFRAVTSEQSSTMVGFLQQLGMQNDQMSQLFVFILLASIAGGAVCAVMMARQWSGAAHVIALSLIAIGALMDSQSNNLTRPEAFYVSQSMIAFGAAMFLPPVMGRGFAAAIQKGVPYLVNFIAIFLFTQISGSVIATGLLGSFVTIREKFHSSILTESISLTDPDVAARVAQLSGAYARTLTDQGLLHAEGLALLGQQVAREAYVLAYNDTFLLLGLATLAALAGLLIHLSFDWLKARFERRNADRGELHINPQG